MRRAIPANLLAVAFCAVAVSPALALKKTPYPEVKIELAEPFKPDAAFTAMRQAFAAAVRAKNADALFALVGPTFVWTVEGGPTDEFDMGRGPLDNFKAVFGFRAVGAEKDGGAKAGPSWDALTAFASDAAFYKAPDAGNLVCGPLAAVPVNDTALDAANKKIETDEEPALWYFTPGEATVRVSPDEASATIIKVSKLALPVIGLHPPDETLKPTHIEVLLPSGRSGWLPLAAARPLVANRLCYARTPSGEWKIAAFDQNED